jgi:hypothetical protein
MEQLNAADLDRPTEGWGTVSTQFDTLVLTHGLCTLLEVGAVLSVIAFDLQFHGVTGVPNRSQEKYCL